MAKPRTQWSKSAFRLNVHSDMFVNNHCEVFNSSIRKFRDLPIITMFRELHKAVMKRIQVRRDKMAGSDTVICPSPLKKLNKAIQYAGNCVVTWSGGTAYSVTCTDGGFELVVDLHKKTCTCRKWELSGIPCYHAAACTAIRNEPWEMHIDACYTKDLYMKLYNCTLEPIMGPEFWQHTSEPRPRPPNVRISAGRPKKKRSTKNDVPQDPTRVSKVGTMVNCTYCKTQGHNTRTCEAKKTDMPKKATEEGQEPNVKKSRNVCKTCNNEGHNSRTCVLKKQLQQQNGQATSAMVQHQDSSNQCTQASSTSGTRKKLTPKKKN